MKSYVSISTKKGDEGESYLADGQKLSKDDLIFEVLGNIDELNSHIGMVVALLVSTAVRDKELLLNELEKVQSNLYLLSGILAHAPGLRFSNKKLERIEKLSNDLQESMADGWTTKFLYPGGSIIGAHLDVARSVCRRCERNIVSYSKNENVRPVVLKYINRLSDLLFILRCYVNFQFGVQEKHFSK